MSGAIASHPTPMTGGGASAVPTHVAIIMDGNGRWAQARGLPRTAGHRQGAESVRVAVETALDLGVRYLTLFGFSSENWKRPRTEVSDLMGLLRLYLRNEVKFLKKNGVRLRVIGDRGRFSADIGKAIAKAEAETRDNGALDLTIALSYGGRDEIVQAARKLAEDVAAGTLAPADIDEKAVAGRLFTHGLPDPDLLIRTSGEQRVSNFLLWQMAYTEFVFTDTLWPDFSARSFRDAVAAYGGRERRYGATGG